MEKIFVMTWSIWTYRNGVIFRKHSVQPGHTIKLVVNLFEYMRYYNIISSGAARKVVHVSMLLVGRGKNADHHWVPPLDGCIKINVDASRRYWMNST